MANKELSPSQQLILTFTMVAIGALLSYVSIFDFSRSSRTAGSAHGDERAPASAVEYAKFETSQEGASSKALLKVNQRLCNVVDYEFEVTNSSFVQIVGDLCPKKPVMEIQMTNMANGHSVTVFLTGTGKYQTDVIPLVPGENLLKVEVQYPDGNMQTSSILVSMTQ